MGKYYSQETFDTGKKPVQYGNKYPENVPEGKRLVMKLSIPDPKDRTKDFKAIFPDVTDREEFEHFLSQYISGLWLRFDLRVIDPVEG